MTKPYASSACGGPLARAGPFCEPEQCRHSGVLSKRQLSSREANHANDRNQGAKLSSPCAESLHLGADASSACGGCAQRSLKKLQRALSTRYDVSEDRERWGRQANAATKWYSGLATFSDRANSAKVFQVYEIRGKIANEGLQQFPEPLRLLNRRCRYPRGFSGPCR